MFRHRELAIIAGSPLGTFRNGIQRVLECLKLGLQFGERLGVVIYAGIHFNLVAVDLITERKTRGLAVVMIVVVGHRDQVTDDSIGENGTSYQDIGRHFSISMTMNEYVYVTIGRCFLTMKR